LATETTTADSGSFSFTGTAVTTQYNRVTPAAVGSFAETGGAATFTKTLPIVAATGSYSITATEADLFPTAGPSAPLPASSPPQTVAFEVSFNEVTFLKPTPRVMELCDRYFEEQLPRLLQWPDPNIWAGGMQKYNMPLPPRPVMPRLNRFYYPTHLCRWGTFWGIMRGDDVAALETVCFATSGPHYATFRIICGGERIETPMTMLPPFKLAEVDDNNQTLYLVTLVDERYERRTLRFVTKETQPTFAPPTWAASESYPTIYNGRTLAGPAGSKIAGNENHSMLSECALYDHAAACLGMVWVRDYGATAGKYLYRTRWETANAAAVTAQLGVFNVDDTYNAGSRPISFDVASTETRRRAIMPATVRVGFPAVTGTITPSGTTDDGKPSWYWRTVNPPGGMPVGVVLAAVTTQEPATYAATPAPAGVPTNSADLTSLADQIGEDFYHALVGSCDLAYPGLVHTDPRWGCDITVDLIFDDPAKTITRLTRNPFNNQYAVDLLLGKDLERPSGSGSANDCTSAPVWSFVGFQCDSANSGRLLLVYENVCVVVPPEGGCDTSTCE